MTFATKLRELRLSRKMTQESLAQAIKLQKSTISMYENGKREPGYEILEAIADTFNVDMNALLDKPAAPQPSTPVSSDGWLAVPISGKAACGEPIEDPSAWDETFYIPPDLAHGHEAHDFLVIRAKGESMEPKILDGDILVFLREYSSEITEPCAVYIEGEGYTVKKVRYDTKGNISLIANNADAYEPHTYTPEEAEAMGLTVHGYLVRMERRNF